MKDVEQAIDAEIKALGGSSEKFRFTVTVNEVDNMLTVAVQHKYLHTLRYVAKYHMAYDEHPIAHAKTMADILFTKMYAVAKKSRA